ncbi:hypothetical protein HPP92_016083 [Vanilla planifolia]|uniref:Protein kinase domain-containing protein n=2 Tax=Vanilla planifolia TaxID=51239 RepID=A0A835QPL2_VANPL|nr:hypothetical protein HPP92_016083 [Vanilla planifolia]
MAIRSSYNGGGAATAVSMAVIKGKRSSAWIDGDGGSDRAKTMIMNGTGGEAATVEVDHDCSRGNILMVVCNYIVVFLYKILKKIMTLWVFKVFMFPEPTKSELIDSNSSLRLGPILEELGSEEPMKSLAGFQDVVVETKDRSKTESEENSDGSGPELPRGVLELQYRVYILMWRSQLGGLLLRKKRRIMRLSTFPQAMWGFVLERKNSPNHLVSVLRRLAHGTSVLSPHGSLASLLHGSKEGLNWKVRFEIVLGIAKGLCYLHEGCQRRIIHRDIKASNILLTDDHTPQIHGSREYFMHGVVNEKIDVFAYGVLLLELITGRRTIDSSRQSLVIWAKPFLEANDIKRLLDPSFGDDYDAEELKRVLFSVFDVHPSHLNIQALHEYGGSASSGDPRTQELMGRASKTAVPLFDACDFEDYTRSRYLSDLHRHKQLALEQ